MKKRTQDIDSDALSTFFQKRMTEEDKKYYFYFNNLWNKGFYDGTLFDPKHARDIQNMVWSKSTKNDIYSNQERLNLDWAQLEVEEALQNNESSILPIDIADTLATHEGVPYAIAYVADYLTQYNPLTEIRSVMSNWITIIGRIVTEERKVKRNTAVSLKDITLHNMTYSGDIGVEKIAAKLIKRSSVDDVLQGIITNFPYELEDAGSSTLRRQMLFDKGLLVASIIRKAVSYTHLTLPTIYSV